ncbi:MAG TPA: response regulator [Thermoanaerobaculia bacterium]|nr:response regulator [Thermoanaerobaculia bacterium]
MTKKTERVLIVDDDEGMLEALGGLLESEGYEVETARNGREAIERLARPPAPGVILLDLKMPVMDGWQFLAARSAQSIAPGVPVVLLSGLAFIPNAPGVADFLTKPIDPTRLLACVRRFCGEPARNGKGDRARREHRT